MVLDAGRPATHNAPPTAKHPLASIEPIAVLSPPTPAARPLGEELFCTEHLHEDLKGRSVRGGTVTLAAQGIKFALGLGSTVVLARLLTPADFGLVAMVTALTGFVAMFKDAGLSLATVQRNEINHAQVSTLFWINVAASVALMLVLATLAPAIAWFYGRPELVYVTLAIAATFVLGGLTPQHAALLKRQMRFTALAAKEITAMACGMVVGMTLAWLGARHWALVAMGATSSLVAAVMVWGLTGWVPGLPRRGTGIRPMLRFGGNLTAAKFVNHFSRNADNILIGWFWGAGALGLYHKAYALMALPINKIFEPLGNVTVPALSRLQNDPARYRQYYFKAVNSVAWLTMPLVALLAAAAGPIILLVLGAQWEGAIPIFQILAVASVFRPIYSSVRWIFYSTGNGGGLLRLRCALAPLFFGCFVLGLPYGPAGVAAAYTIGFLLAFPFVLGYAFRGTRLTLTGLAAALWCPAVTALGMAAGAWGVGALAPAPDPADQLVLAGLGAVLGAATSLLVPAVRGELFQVATALRSGLGARTSPGSR